MNEQYSDLGTITAATSVCMTIDGVYEGVDYTIQQCGALDWCGTSGVTGNEPYTISCSEPSKGGSASGGEDSASKTIISAVTAVAALVYAM